MSVLCSLKNINLAFGQKVLFQNAQFQIEHGDKIGLIGLNGMGKSSLFKILLEDITPDTSNPVFVFDKATAKLGQHLKYTVFLVEQKFKIPNSPTKAKDYFLEYYPQIKILKQQLAEIESKLESSSDEKLISKQHECSEKLEQLGYWRVRNEFESYLKSFKVENIDADVKDLSGGEQRKVLLSLGLTSEANLILWDEPTNHLDFDTIAEFEEELLKTNKTFIIISHDRYLLSKVTNKICHINQAEINSYKGSYADYLSFLDGQEENRKKMLTKLRNSLRRETDWMRQGIKARGTRSKKRVENFHQLSSKVQNLKDLARKSMEVTMNKSNRKTKQLCQYKDVDFSYDKKEIFKHIDFTLYKGDKIGVIGENGVGKSTLMKLITQELTPTSGKTKYADDLKICYFSQNKEELNKDKSPYDLLGDGEDFIHFKSGRSLHVASYFQNYLFNLDELHRPLSTFSGGEINRLQLAMNLKNEADIWIFDEPTNDLDIESIEILENKLAEFDGTVIIISHDRTFLENVTNKIWLIKDKDLQVFTSGYSHVAPYLEVCELEDEIKKSEKEEKSTAVVDDRLKKVNNQQREKEIQRIESDIMEKESLIEEIDSILSKFDYSNMDNEKIELVAKLNEKKSNCEEELLALYEEMEEV
jgi:ATP-binding cassette subfamily F protein uup